MPTRAPSPARFKHLTEATQSHVVRSQQTKVFFWKIYFSLFSEILYLVQFILSVIRFRRKAVLNIFFHIKRFISKVEKIAREEGKYQVHGFIQLLMLLLLQIQLRSNANDNQSQFCAVLVGFAIVNAETNSKASVKCSWFFSFGTFSHNLDHTFHSSQEMRMSPRRAHHVYYC